MKTIPSNKLARAVIRFSLGMLLVYWLTVPASAQFTTARNIRRNRHLLRNSRASRQSGNGSKPSVQSDCCQPCRRFILKGISLPNPFDHGFVVARAHLSNSLCISAMVREFRVIPRTRRGLLNYGNYVYENR